MNPVAPGSATSGCAAAPVDGTVTSGLPQEATLQHSVAFSSHFLRWCPQAIYQQITTGTELWGEGRDHQCGCAGCPHFRPDGKSGGLVHCLLGERGHSALACHLERLSPA